VTLAMLIFLPLKETTALYKEVFHSALLSFLLLSLHKTLQFAENNDVLLPVLLQYWSEGYHLTETTFSLASDKEGSSSIPEHFVSDIFRPTDSGTDFRRLTTSFLYVSFSSL
jgi:hypothetical protein